ncbi:MAG: YhdP family protein, partial [Burkholderiales bacterium]
YPIELERGRGALRAWATVARGRVGEATADLSLTDVRARMASDLPVLELAALRGRLQGGQSAGNYRLSARELELLPQNAATLPALEFQLAWDAAGGSASANVLELAPLAHLGEALPLPAELRRATRELEPRGQLSALRYEWQGALAEPLRYRAVGRFADLSVKPHEALPGFSKLAGSVELSDAGGHVRLDTHGAELALPRVFAERRLSFDVLAGEASWQREGARVSVQIPSLTFTNADLSGNAFGSYVYDGAGPGAIDLSAVLSRADARSLAHYLPLGVLMGEKPHAWLVRSILAGEASDVRVRLQGDLRRFPFVDPKQGEFRVSARVRNGILDYTADWPRIEAIDAELVFERNRMDIAGKSGAILGASLHDVRVRMADLGSSASHVRVSGQAEGPTAEFLKFIASSPLRATAGRFTEAMSATGNGRLQLRLDLPLADLRSTGVEGEYDLEANDVVLSRALPPLEKTQGHVSFTESSLTLRDMRSSIFGGTVTFGGGTRAGGGMEFMARGEAQSAELGSLLDTRLQRHLSGSAPYAVTVNMREGLERVLVESSLRGIASALPAPFEKAAADALPLRVELTRADAGTRDRITVSLARTSADVRRRREGESMQVQRAGLALSAAGQPVRLPNHGLLVYGSVASLDLDRWRAVLPATGARAEGRGLPTALEVRSASAEVLGKRIHNLALRANGDAAGWSAVVDADELAGKLEFRAEEGGRLVARLLHLTVPEAPEGATPTATGGKATDLPAVDLTAETFSVRGKELGRLELRAAPDADDWRIDKLALSNGDATFQAKGRWRSGARAASAIDFALDASDAGNFLARVGYPGMVLGGKAILAGSLDWAGDLTVLDYPSLSGELKLTVEDGQFLEIDPGVGKLISLMNLQALPRRIALDFRDVFSKGFRFDRIDATSRIEKGVMDINQFHMRGPAADVAMAGKVDVAHESQELKVRVVPSLGGSAS